VSEEVIGALSRRAFLGLVPGVVVLRGSEALAQRPREPARVGWLSYVGQPDPGLENLRNGLRELGYVEGKSDVLVPKFADGDFTRLPKLVEEFAGERLDVLVSRGPSVDYTKAIRAKVPVVFAYSGDPVESGFADSLAKPGRNMTGITFMALELSVKRIELLRELLPKATRLALLSNPEHAGELAEYRISEEAAKRVGFTMTRYVVRNPQDLMKAYGEIRAARPDAMIVFPDSLTLVRRKEIADFAADARIPTMYGWSEYAEAGGLASYGARLTDNFKTLARFVDKIIKGGNANTIPIEQVGAVGLTLNLAAARALGVTVPQPLLYRAERVIE
jgi:putative ABC transport system substrate-binding protein